MGHGGDAGEGFAPEPQGRDREEVFRRSYLARRVALERQDRVLSGHSAAVVRDPDEAAPGLAYLHLDARRPGVDGVLHEFFDDGGRPLDHLARGDLVHQVFVEDDNSHAGADSPGPQVLLPAGRRPAWCRSTSAR